MAGQLSRLSRVWPPCQKVPSSERRRGRTARTGRGLWVFPASTNPARFPARFPACSPLSCSRLLPLEFRDLRVKGCRGVRRDALCQELMLPRQHPARPCEVRRGETHRCPHPARSPLPAGALSTAQLLGLGNICTLHKVARRSGRVTPGRAQRARAAAEPRVPPCGDSFRGEPPADVIWGSPAWAGGGSLC